MYSLRSPAAAPGVAAAAASRRSRAARPPGRRLRSGYCAAKARYYVRTTPLEEDTAPQSDFLRYVHEPGAAEALLQTSVVTLERSTPEGAAEPPLRVDLVSAVHIGDAAYFDELQARLNGYDRVLYELVAVKPKLKSGRRWRPPPPSRNSVFDAGAFAQRFFANPRAEAQWLWAYRFVLGQQFSAYVLGLKLQQSWLDYSHDHWYHADLELPAFTRLQRERNESWQELASLFRKANEQELRKQRRLAKRRGKAGGQVSAATDWMQLLRWSHDTLPLPFFFQLVMRSVLNQAEGRPLNREPVLGSFLNLDISGGLKLMMAKELTEPSVFDSALRHTALLGERNKIAVAGVKVSMQDGVRSIAILYGSAHMPDIEQRLVTKLGMRRVGITWLDAWRMPLRRVAPSEQRMQRRQAAALGLLSLLLAADLSLWEQLLGWVVEHLPHLAA